MVNGLYYVIIIIVAVGGIFLGYRRGILRQIGGVLGMAFGIVTVRMTAPDTVQYIDQWIPPVVSGFKREFLVQSITCSSIYLVVSFFIQLCALPINKLMVGIGGGMGDQLAGAVFKLFKYLFILSLVYNVMVDMNPSGSMAKYSCQHDGNLVEGVIKIAPPILGFPDGEEVGKRQQLEDARSIS